MIVLLSDELYRDHTPVCPSCLHHPRVQDLCLCRAADCAQLHGVTELWRGGETELEASRPAPASSNFAALQTAMAGYSVDTM